MGRRKNGEGVGFSAPDKYGAKRDDMKSGPKSTRGRPPSSIKGWIRVAMREAGYKGRHTLTPQEFAQLMASVGFMSRPQLERIVQMAKNDPKHKKGNHVPIVIEIIAEHLISDDASRQMNMLRLVLDRAFGQPTREVAL